MVVSICISLMTYDWRRKWQPTPVFLPGESHGLRSLAGCSPWGRKESDTTERQAVTYDIDHLCIFCGEVSGYFAWFLFGFSKSSLCIWTLVLYLTCVLQKFPPRWWFAFLSSQCVLQFFILMRSCLSILPFTDSAFSVLSKKSLLSSRSPRFSFTLFSRSFMIFVFYV